MKKFKCDYSTALYIIYGIFTLTVFQLWYIHNLSMDVNVMCRKTGKKTSGVVAYILFTVLTLGLYSVFWWYRLADMIDRTMRRHGIESSAKPSYVLFCMIIGQLVAGIASYVGINAVLESANELALHYRSNAQARAELEEATV